MSSYDVFLSHNSEDKPWVETLAENLRRHGVEPFLDIWHLKLGESFVTGLKAALDRSRHGILICTPNTTESYWVNDEYEEMKLRRQNDPEFRIIPLLARGRVPELFGARAINAVDFRGQSESAYRIAFRRLLCGISGEEPGPDQEFDGELEFPEFATSDTVSDTDQPASLWTADVTGQLDENRVLLLLAQADRLAEQERRGLFTHAHQRFGEQSVYRVHVPRHAANVGEFFEDVGFQCGLEGTDSLLKFKFAFNELVGDREVLLIVFGFESCAEDMRRTFSSCLRAAYDQLDGLHVLIAGGRGLHQLYIKGEEGSLFNVAKAEFCPDPGQDDVLTEWSRRRSDDPQVHIAKSMLDVSGAHPRLLHECWGVVGEGDSLDTTEVSSMLSDLLVLARAFSASAQTPADRENCAELLTRKIAGPWNSSGLPEPLASLFWNNLLCRDGDSLRWRCDAVREVGKRFIRASNTAEDDRPAQEVLDT